MNFWKKLFRGDSKRKSVLNIGGKSGAPTAADLVSAAISGSLDKLCAMLDKGADVDAKDSDGRTALIAGSRFGHLNVVQSLLERGADVNSRDHKGWNSLMMAGGLH